MNTVNTKQSGIAHLGLVLLVVAVTGVVGVTYWKVSSSNSTQNREVGLEQTSIAQPLPQDLKDLKTIEEIEQSADATNGATIVSYVLESEDGNFVYNLVLSNGKRVRVNAATGVVLTETTTKLSDDDKAAAGIKVNLSLASAYRLAAAKSSSPIKKIEMEVEDKKIVYKIEYVDGSKIEIDATSSSVVKSEIKSESKKTERSESSDSQDQNDDDRQPENESEADDNTEDGHDDNNDSRDDQDREDEDR